VRPQNKKHKTFFTHRQQKIPRTKPQKRKNKQQQNNHYLLLFFYRIRVHYTVLTQHTTPHTTPTPDATQKHIGHNQQKVLLHQGVINRTTTVLF